jgi:hypothetical protein
VTARCSGSRSHGRGSGHPSGPWKAVRRRPTAASAPSRSRSGTTTSSWTSSPASTTSRSRTRRARNARCRAADRRLRPDAGARTVEVRTDGEVERGVRDAPSARGPHRRGRRHDHRRSRHPRRCGRGRGVRTRQRLEPAQPPQPAGGDDPARGRVRHPADGPAHPGGGPGRRPHPGAPVRHPAARVAGRGERRLAPRRPAHAGPPDRAVRRQHRRGRRAGGRCRASRDGGGGRVARWSSRISPATRSRASRRRRC